MKKTKDQIKTNNLKKAEAALEELENGRDNDRYQSIKLYQYLAKQYPQLFTPTTFQIYEHIRLKARCCKESHGKYRFNTNHYDFADALELNQKVVRRHLLILLLVGLLRREDVGQKKKHYWYNYFICNMDEQKVIETKNHAAIAKLINSKDKGKTTMRKRRESIKDLRNEVAKLTSHIDQLEMKVKKLQAQLNDQMEKWDGEEYF